MDLVKFGVGGCIGDIGIYVINLVIFVIDFEVKEVVVDFDIFVSGWGLDDNV